MRDMDFPIDGDTKGVVLTWLDVGATACFFLHAATAYGAASAMEAGFDLGGTGNGDGEVMFRGDQEAAARFAPRATPLARIALEHGHDAARDAFKTEGFDNRLRVRFPENEHFLVEYEERTRMVWKLNWLLPEFGLLDIPAASADRKKVLWNLGKHLGGQEASARADEVLMIDSVRLPRQASVTVL